MGYLYRPRGSRTWYFGVKQGRRWIRLSTRTQYRPAAEAKMRAAELRLSQGKALDEEPGETFGAFAEEYLAHKAGLGYDVERDRDCLAHLLPIFGEAPLTEIDRESVERYVTRRRAEKAKPGTIQKEINLIRAAFNQAERWQRVTHNPVAKLTVKGADTPRERLPSEDELAKLTEACPSPLRNLVQVALLTGMRRGELLALEERDCDFLREEIRVRQSKSGDPRTIPMHPRVREILWGLCRGVEARRVFPLTNVQRPFTAAVKAAGLRDVRFHDLRHCTASYLFMSGADPRTVMQILGHRDPRMTLRVYARVNQSHMREAVNRLSLPSGAQPLTISQKTDQEPDLLSDR